MRYGKLIDGNVEFAKESRWIDGNFYTKLDKAQHLALDEKPIYELPSPATLSAGFHWEEDGWREQDAGIIKKWKLVEDQISSILSENPSQEQEQQEIEQPVDDGLIRISKAKVEAIIDEMDMTSIFIDWLQSKASYFGGWMRSGDIIEYDPMDNESDLASLLEVLQLSREDAAALIEEVKA